MMAFSNSCKKRGIFFNTRLLNDMFEFFTLVLYITDAGYPKVFCVACKVDLCLFI